MLSGVLMSTYCLMPVRTAITQSGSSMILRSYDEEQGRATRKTRQLVPSAALRQWEDGKRAGGDRTGGVLSGGGGVKGGRKGGGGGSI